MIRTYLQYLIDVQADREWALTTTPWHVDAPFTNEVPPGFELFANRIVSLGFEHYPIPEPERLELCQHYLNDGVRIPGTPHKIRVAVIGRAEFVPSEGAEPELPADWLRYVAVEDVFVGKQVAPLLGIDLSGYVATPDGWLRDEPCPHTAPTDIQGSRHD
jgi:hypothetical protein